MEISCDVSLLDPEQDLYVHRVMASFAAISGKRQSFHIPTKALTDWPQYLQFEISQKRPRRCERLSQVDITAY
jgi:hypothetical protein